VRLGPTSLFDIASTSKQFTAATILLLADDGRLDLDDPVQAYVPELPEYDAPVTVRHLVHHTSGIRDYIALRHIAGIDDRDWFGMQDVLDHVVAQRALNFAPGSRHLYSNSGYVLLAVIVSRLTGQSFGETCRERILAPLGMESSSFREDSALILHGMVQMYHLDERDRLRKVTVNDDVVGDGALLTTLRDLARWDGNNVRRIVGGPDFFERMAASGTPPEDPVRYGFGLQSGDYRGLRTVSHGGNLTGFNGEYLRFPDQDLTVISLANHGGIDSSATARRVADVFLAGALSASSPPSAGDTPAGPLGDAAAQTAVAAAELVSQYRDADSGLVLDVVLGDAGELSVVVGDRTIPLVHRVGRLFTAHYQEIDLDVVFAPRDDGATELRFVHEGEPLLSGTSIPPLVAADIDLQAYAGAYCSDEVPGTCELTVDDGALVMRRCRAKPDRLRPALADEFATAYGSIRFVRDDGGSVTGMVASMSRTWGVQYWRSAGC
jgi:CubicO group peptidase (beta-lactamase class C family)